LPAPGALLGCRAGPRGPRPRAGRSRRSARRRRRRTLPVGAADTALAGHHGPLSWRLRQAAGLRPARV